MSPDETIAPGVDPNATLPMGLTDPRPQELVGSSLDDGLRHRAPQLFRHYLDLCGQAERRELHLLAFECAKAAAHWRRIAYDDRAKG